MYTGKRELRFSHVLERHAILHSHSQNHHHARSKDYNYAHVSTTIMRKTLSLALCPSIPRCLSHKHAQCMHHLSLAISHANTPNVCTIYSSLSLTQTRPMYAPSIPRCLSHKHAQCMHPHTVAHTGSSRKCRAALGESGMGDTSYVEE
jgi:hypothetical protein